MYSKEAKKKEEAKEQYKIDFSRSLHYQYEVSQQRTLRALVDHFNMEELKTLSFELGVDIDALPGEGRRGKARELVVFMTKQLRLYELVAYIWIHRPRLSIRRLFERRKKEKEESSGGGGFSVLSGGRGIGSHPPVHKPPRHRRRIQRRYGRRRHGTPLKIRYRDKY